MFDFLTGRTTTQQVVDPQDAEAGEGHLGADAALTAAFLAAVRDRRPELVLTTPAEGLATHQIVWAAERARHCGQVKHLI